MFKIGILDDDANMRHAIAALLIENQFQPIPMAAISEFSEVQKTIRLDLVLIDLRLRGESGLDLTATIRRSQDLPIIMLSGHADSTDIVVGLRLGADDYLCKPFDPKELIARIQALLRRSGPTQHSPEPDADGVMFGRFTLDHVRRVLFDDAQDIVPMTQTEFDLLCYFVRNPNRVVSRAELVAGLNGDKSDYVDRSIGVLVLRLRRKIEANPQAPAHLQTRRGKGYFFAIADAEAHL